MGAGKFIPHFYERNILLSDPDSGV